MKEDDDSNSRYHWSLLGKNTRKANVQRQKHVNVPVRTQFSVPPLPSSRMSRFRHAFLFYFLKTFKLVFFLMFFNCLNLLISIIKTF